MTVTIVGNNDSKVYNGSTQSVTGFTFSAAKGETTIANSEFTVALKEGKEAEASGKDVGHYTMDLTKDDFTVTSKNYSKITVVYTDGYLDITPVTDEVTVTIVGNKGSKVYNGSDQSVTGFTFSIASEEGEVDKSDFTVTLAEGSKAEANGKNVNKYQMGLTAEDFDVSSDKYSNITVVVVDGALTITKAKLTITTGSGSKTYDGSALTNATAKIEGLLGEDKATVKATGSQTAVGSSSNTYNITWTNGTADNYTITEKLGTLKVTAAGGGNPPGGGGGGPAPGPGPGGGPAPGGDGTVIPDDPAPTVDPPVDIVDPEPPLAEGTWALINLISAIITALGAAVALFRKKEDEEDEAEDEDNMYKSEDEDEEEEDDNRGKKMLAAKIAGALAGVAAPITFILTEDMSLPMAMIDKWTILMLIMLAVQIVAAVFNKKASEAPDEEEEETAEEAAN